MLTRPRFKPHYHVEIAGEDGIFLLSEGGHFVLTGRLNQLLAPFLVEGCLTTDEIVDRLQDEAEMAQLYYALSVMEQKGYIAEADDDVAPSMAAFFHALGVETRLAVNRLAETGVAVRTFGDLPPFDATAALAGAGLSVREEGDFALVVVDDYLQRGLEALNVERLASGEPWMLVKPVGSVLWVGPVFRPGESACWECLAQRLRGNREVERFLLSKKESDTPLPVSRIGLPTTVQTALGMAATEAARWIAGGRGTLQGEMVTLDVLAMQSGRHTLVRRPQCPRCGDAATRGVREATPVVLESQPKRFTEDGGHRVATPEETVKRYSHHISPITGAVSVLGRGQGDDEGLLNVYVAGHNLAQRPTNLSFLKQGLRSKSAGKGMSDLQARASGLCEAIERYSGVFQGDEPRRLATIDELGDAAIDPQSVMMYSERQYQNRDGWNSTGSGFTAVSNPFDRSARLEWSPVWSLTRGEFRYLPTSYLYYSYPIDHATFHCWADSNGNAAGNTLEEAILQGFFELVERDAVAIWWYNRLRRPAVDLDSFDEPYIGRLRAFYKNHNRDLWVLDITSDLGIPVFVALSHRTDTPAEDIVFAFGAHFDARIALLRAITELNQFIPAVLNMAADGSGDYLFHDPLARRWWSEATLANQPYLAPDEQTPVRTAASFPQMWTDDIRDDVELCRRLVEERGMEMLVLDQTQPDIGLPVAKVIVPGMRHFWARFAPGRLYDVPVQMGWLPRPLTEDELNPIPMFI